MILSMGDAIEAYELTPGKPAYNSDLVNIFEPCRDEEYASIEEKEDAMFSMLDRDLEFIDNHAGFAIAFRPVKWKNVKKWIPCMLYKYGGEWRRVVLQYADCSACGWHGNTASPTEPDLYITLENRFEILKRMGQLSFRSCPVCGSRISTKAIWIEEG